MTAEAKAIVLYLPVLHQGYIEFFSRHNKEPNELWVLGADFIHELSPLHEEIRALSPELMHRILKNSGLAGGVRVLERSGLEFLRGRRLISARDGISDRFIEKYLPDNAVMYDSVFLKWSENSVAKTAPAGFDRVSTSEFDRSMMRLAREQSKLSGDWWRQIGGVLVKGWHPHILGYNRHVPSQFMPYVLGDPRDFIPAGERSEISTTLHCEESLILEAAKRGIETKGSWIVVPTFPCPRCAKLIAYSGVTKVFFAEGHASLDGESVMRANGVELILVQE